MFERILVPVDGSRYARCALEMSAELARCHGSRVFLLHVIRDLSLPQEIMQMIKSGEVTESRMGILEDSAEIILDNAKVLLGESGISDIKCTYLLGDPATTILQHARDNEVDLIVLGHRGLGPTEGLLGGVARKLLNKTNVSCLIATQAP